MFYRIHSFIQRSLVFATTLPPVAYLIISILVNHPAAALVPVLLGYLSSPIFFILIGLSLAFDLLAMKLIPEQYQMPTWISLLIAWTLFFIWVL